MGLETSPTDYNAVAIDKGGARPADGTSALRVRKRTRQRGCQTWRKSNVCFCQEQSEGERAREREREKERERTAGGWDASRRSAFRKSKERERERENGRLTGRKQRERERERERLADGTQVLNLRFPRGVLGF